MDKNEILSKAQNESKNKPDEMELQIVSRGQSISLVVILCFCFILMIVKIIADQCWYDVYSLMFASIGVTHLYKASKVHQKHEWFLGIFGCILAVATLAAAIYSYLG